MRVLHWNVNERRRRQIQQTKQHPPQDWCALERTVIIPLIAAGDESCADESGDESGNFIIACHILSPNQQSARKRGRSSLATSAVGPGATCPSSTVYCVTKCHLIQSEEHICRSLLVQFMLFDTFLLLANRNQEMHDVFQFKHCTHS